MAFKKVERRDHYGWIPVEFEHLMVGDIFRVIESGQANEVGRILVVLSEPKQCDPPGNWEFQCEVIDSAV